MRQVLISVMLFGVVGAILGHSGIYANNWPFWGIIVSMMLLQINSAY